MLRIVLLLMLSMPAFAAIDVYQFDNEQQEQRFRILSEELRCPKCQNQSIADSDAGIAQDMRTRVHTMIHSVAGAYFAVTGGRCTDRHFAA